MITNVYKAIRRHIRTVTYQNLESESYVDGEFTPVFSDSTEFECAILPMSPREAKYFPESMYDIQDKVLYEIGGPTLNLKSLVTHDSKEYYVNQRNERIFEGGFTKYHLKENNE